MVADSMGEVAFAQTGIGQEIKRTAEAAVAVGDSIGSLEGKAIARSHHELIKSESAIQTVKISVLLLGQRKRQLAGIIIARWKSSGGSCQPQMYFFGGTAVFLPTAFNLSQIVLSDPVEKEAVRASEGHFTLIGNDQIQGINPHFIAVDGDTTLQVILGPSPDVFHNTPLAICLSPLQSNPLS